MQGPWAESFALCLLPSCWNTPDFEHMYTIRINIMLPWKDQVLLTRIHGHYNNDTHIPLPHHLQIAIETADHSKGV
jgi:hypothetical protein